MEDPRVDGWTWTQLNNITSIVCVKCITQRSCNMYRHRLSKNPHRRRLMDCSLIKKYLGDHPEIKIEPLSKPSQNDIMPLECKQMMQHLESGSSKAHEIMVKQQKTNPEAMQVLYSDSVIESDALKRIQLEALNPTKEEPTDD